MTNKRRNNPDWKFDTRAIHAQQEFDAATGAIIPPIYATSTYANEAPGKHLGFDYARSQNPTRFAYERALADLEGGTAGFAFASGLAATATIFDMLPQGSHVVSVDDLYGGSYRLFERILKPTSGLEVSYVDLTDPKAFAAAIRPNTRMLWIETPTNPLLKLVDMEAVAAIAKKHNIITVCDNTFATPWVHAPIRFGFDMVMHSTTKYINGHSDIIGGAVVVGDNAELRDKMKFLQNAIGAIASPFDCFLTHRGLKTLGIRMERHCSNAMAVAQWLEKHPKIQRVYYPGLASHPQHALAKKQMHGFGGMIAATVKGSLEQTTEFLKRCELFILAQSLGGVESLISQPALMTHASIPADVRHKTGIEDGLVRLSVGIENADDLIADLDAALKAVA
jgi:cystathionine gamma-lyase